MKPRKLFRAIDSSWTWDKTLSVNQHTQAITELVFWKKHFSSLNERKFVDQTPPDLLIASDASATGLEAHTQVGEEHLIVRKNFSPEEGAESSAHREVHAILYALASLQDVCRGKKVLWFTDNFAASRVVAKGSGKEPLQDMAEKIFNICKIYDIKSI